MTFEKFINAVAQKVEERVERYKTVYVHPVHKNNGITYQGLVIYDPLNNIHPTIFLDPYYDKYRNGVSMEDTVKGILDTYYKNRPAKEFDISAFRDFEKVKDRIVMKLVNTELNKELLEDVPHKQMGDFSIIYNVIVQNFVEGYATILVYDAHLDLWGITQEELHEIAMENTPKLLPYRFECLEYTFEEIFQRLGLGETEIKMHLLSNRQKINGAVAMFYPNILKKIYDFLEDNLVIIPSSIHEVFIIPEQVFRNESSVEELNDTIEMVNETNLDDEEILSNHAYLFDGTELAVLK